MKPRNANDADVLESLQRDPAAFIALCWPDAVLWEKQTCVADAVAGHKRVAVRSGHGVGKSWLMARLAIWFLTVFKPSKVVTTAPSWTQVEKVLWGEIATAYRSSRIPLGGDLLNTQWKIADDCFAIGISTRESVEQRDFGSTKLQGFHSPNLLVILDEAAGVPPEIWTATTSLATGENNRIVAIGNPASPSGPFYDIFKSPIWHKLEISCLDHPNVTTGETVIPGAVTKDWVEERKTEWGEKSPLYQAKVLGQFPTEGSDTLIPLTWVERAVNAEIAGDERLSVGCDVARFGEDETVIFKSKGNTYELVEAVTKRPTNETAGRLVLASKESGAEFVAVDDTGVGGGVTDMLREQGMSVVPVNFGSAAEDPERFANLKAEIFWNLREDFEKKNISIPDDPVLMNQLASIKYGLTSKGQIKIESKDDAKKRGLRSPDRADALAICHYAKRANWIPEMLWI